MRNRILGLLIVVAASAAACGGGAGTAPSGAWKTLVPIAQASPAAPQGPSATSGPTKVTVSLGQTSPTQMFIQLSTATAPSGKVSFYVTNSDHMTHEFVVLKTDTPAGSIPIGSFEGESNRIDEDTAGENVGETGDMKAGETKTLAIDLAPGHYAVVCNLPGHYRAGMHQDFQVT